MRLTQIQQAWIDRSWRRLERLVRSRLFLFYVTAYLLFAATAFRVIADLDDSYDLGYAVALLLAYFILLSIERPVSTRYPWFQKVYFPVQIVLVFLLSDPEPAFDYYPTLYMALCIQAVWFASQKAAVGWILLMLAFTILGEVMVFGFERGMGFTLTYIAAGFFITIFGLTTLRAEKARMESQALLAELQTAHSKLIEYTDQIEELAAVKERNRLARELHDSVTQTIFGMTLTAQSALILLERDPSRVREQLTHLQSLSKSALAEMRALIQQLHPPSLADEGLASALRRHASERKAKDGLSVTVEILANEDPPPRLPTEVEECLLRVAQEALNNVVKHAQTVQAAVRLDLRTDPLRLTIEDQGVGFIHGARKGEGHFGLVSMEERVRAIGGRLEIESQPGAGTRIWVEVLRAEERIHA